MDNHENLRLRDPAVTPSSDVLMHVLGASFAAYEALQDALPDLDIEQIWQWYTPHKAWFASGRYSFATPRGAHKEKTLYWLHVYEGCFSVAVWFKEKNRARLLAAPVSEATKRLILEAKTMGKVATFPVVFDVTAVLPADTLTLINLKKQIEI